MERVLTWAQQREYKPFSEKNVTRFNQLREECIVKDLTELLGASLVSAIVANPTSQRVLNILDAYNFTGLDGFEKSHPGLRCILSYFIYARYIGESDVSDTFTGLVRKSRTESEPIGDGRIRMMQGEAREIAIVRFALIKEFLELNLAVYPEWNAGAARINFKPRMINLRKTIR